MAAKTKVDTLCDFRKCVRKSMLNGSQIETDEYLVVAMNRYVGDPKHLSQIGITGLCEVMDVIQLTMADGRNKMKVILDSCLNTMVQTCKLQAGHMVTVTKCRLHYDDSNLFGNCVLIVEELTVTGFKSVIDTSEISKLSWCDDCSCIEQIDVPLTSSRAYFVSIWSTMEMYGSIWKTQGTEVDIGSTDNIYKIKDIALKRGSLKTTEPSLLVRVLLKSRIGHYAKSSQNDKWPFKAHLQVGDSSGVCTAVLWNAMCPNFYHRIKCGTVLLLKKFTVKKSYTQIPRLQFRLKNMNLFDIDINLNSHHPESQVSIVNCPKLLQELPDLPFSFVNRRQAGCLPNNYLCDIAGCVTYVGRYEREHMNIKFGTDSGGFWIQRWLHLRDGTSNQPFYIQLYRIAEGMVDLDIQPGMLLMCTYMRVVFKYEHMSTSHTDRHMFLTSTAETQICVIDKDLQKQMKDQPVIAKLCTWSASTHFKSYLRKACVGGYPIFPSLPHTTDELKSSIKDDQVVACMDWQKVIHGLCYRESRQIIVHASMVKLRHHSASAVSKRKSSGKESHDNKITTSDHEITVNPDVYQSDQPLTCLGSHCLDKELSFPIVYKSGQWAAIKQMLEFPTTDIQNKVPCRNTDQGFDYQFGSYLTITWAGMNNRLLLQTHLLWPQIVTENTTLLDIFYGNSGQHAIYAEEKIEPTHTQIESVLESAVQFADKRFLLILDCYQAGTDYNEIIVNRAMPLVDL